MGQVINLNKARKARAKQARRMEADQNSSKFGRTKTQRSFEDAERTKSDAKLDAHKRDDE